MQRKLSHLCHSSNRMMVGRKHVTQAPSSGGNDCQVGHSWPCVEQKWSNIVILNLVHPMAPQGATRIKKGLPCVCPTGMELGEALRNTEKI